MVLDKHTGHEQSGDLHRKTPKREAVNLSDSDLLAIGTPAFTVTLAHISLSASHCVNLR